MEIKAIEFEYNDTIEVVSMRQYAEHYKLYVGYVQKVNELQQVHKEQKEDCAPGNATYSDNRNVHKGESYALDGVILHEHYFENIGGQTEPHSQALKDVFARNFGGYANWIGCFKETAKSARGWVALVWEQRSKRYLNMMLDWHETGLIVGAYPLLVLDMYEHAYFMDYGTNKDGYIERFLNNVNWTVVNQRLERLRQSNEK